MALDVDRVCSQPKKFRKNIKTIFRDDTPEAVHKLRTRARQLEATIAALGLASRRTGSTLLKSVKPLRRKAGQVRDMDVLTDFAAQVRFSEEAECSVMLLEHLGVERDRGARKLRKLAKAEYSTLGKDLKQYARFLDRSLGSADEIERADSEGRATAAALRLERELRDWPTLTRANLHPFRLQVKELRNVLRMADKYDNDFVAALGEVKDAIGEWHDWDELVQLSKELIQHSACKLVSEFRSIAEKKFGVALRAANQMRKTFLENAAPIQRAGGRGKRNSRRADSALVAVAALAA